jgi:hypothetical protein
MEAVPCGTTNYNYTNVEEIVLKQVSVANCVKDKSLLKVKGTLYGKHAQFLEIRVQPCLDPTTVDNINSTICANMSEQAAFYRGVRYWIKSVAQFSGIPDQHIL